MKGKKKENIKKWKHESFLHEIENQNKHRKNKEEKILLNKKKLRHVTHRSIEPNLKFSRMGFDRQYHALTQFYQV